MLILDLEEEPLQGAFDWHSQVVYGPRLLDNFQLPKTLSHGQSRDGPVGAPLRQRIGAKNLVV